MTNTNINNNNSNNMIIMTLLPSIPSLLSIPSIAILLQKSDNACNLHRKKYKNAKTLLIVS